MSTPSTIKFRILIPSAQNSSAGVEGQPYILTLALSLEPEGFCSSNEIELEQMLLGGLNGPILDPTVPPPGATGDILPPQQPPS